MLTICPLQNFVDFANPGVKIEADQSIGSEADSRGPLRIFAQGETGDREERGLFLNPAGIGENQVRGPP